MTDDERYSVKEYIEKAISPRLDRIEEQLATLLSEGSAEAREAMTLARGNTIDIGHLTSWRNKIVGGFLVISVLYGALIVAMGFAMKFF